MCALKEWMYDDNRCYFHVSENLVCKFMSTYEACCIYITQEQLGCENWVGIVSLMKTYDEWGDLLANSHVVIGF